LGIDHVYVMSNAVSMRRPVGWDSESTTSAENVISGFFRFYKDGAATEQPSSEEQSEPS
jgi:hypothetical protein